MRQEAGIFAVAFPVFKIDLLVCDVDVAAKNEVALCLELEQVGVKLVEEAELRQLTLFPG